MKCQFCQYPVEQDQSCCSNCGTPLSLPLTPQKLRPVDALAFFGHALEMVVLLGLGFGMAYLCYRVSPLIAMFPLFIVMSRRS